MIDAKAEFGRSGYVHVPSLISRREAHALRDEVHLLAERQGHVDATWSSVRSGPNGGQARLTHSHDLQHYSAAFTRLILDDRLIGILRQLIGPNIQLHHTKMLIKPPNTGASFPMHQDYEYFPHAGHSMTAAIVHLDDAPLEKGCLRVYPGSHRLGPLAAQGDDHRLSSVDFPIEEAHPIPAQAGDVIFFSYLLVHGSAGNTSSEARTTVLIQVRDPSDQPIADKHVSKGQGMMLAGIDPLSKCRF